MRERPQSSGAGGIGWLGWIASSGLKRPKLALAIAAVALLVCGYVAHDMPVSTSRYELVSEQNPFQSRLIRFFDQFGYPDALVVVLSGGTAEERREAVDTLTERYEQHPELEGRVLGRMKADHVAELLLLMQPEALTEMKRRVEGDPAELIEGGMPMWLGAVELQLERGLEGDPTAPPLDDTLPDGEQDAAAASEKDVDEAFRDLARLFEAFEERLAGGDAIAELPELEGIDIPDERTVDDEGYLTSEHGDHHFIALFPELPGAEGYQVKPMVDEVRAIRDRAELGGVEAQVTGLPALVADELVVVERGIAQTSGATTTGIVLLFLLFFRSVRYTILALIPLGVGIVLTLAAVRGLYGGLNLVTSSFVPVLLALGIDFGVYVLSRYGELVRQGASTLEAIRGALDRAGPGMLMGAITTMMAFLMTTTTEFTAYSELGVITASGLALMLVATFLLLPALIYLAGRGRKIESPELGPMAHMAAVVRKARWVLPAAGVAIAAAATLTFGSIEFNARYFDFLPEDTESAAGLRRIEHDQLLSPIQASSGAGSVEEARALTDEMRDLPSVGAVQSATDMMPKLTDERLRLLREGFEAFEREPQFDALRNRERSTEELATEVQDLIDLLDEIAFGLRRADRSTAAVDEAKKAAKGLKKRIEAMPDDAPVIAETERTVADILERAWTTGKRVAERGHYEPTDLPSVFRARFMSRDGTSLAVYSNPAKNIWEADNARRFAEQVTGVDPEASGLAVTIHEHMRMIKEGFTRASILSGSLVLLVLLAGFRKLHDALFAMLPVAFGVMWMLGFMGVVGLDFDVANVVALPLILGVGIDAGAHMMHRWRHSANAHGGIARLDEIIRGTGAAVLMAGLTTATGFAALMLGDYGGMKSLGLSMTVGVVSCLFASLLILPAVLVLTRRAE